MSAYQSTTDVSDSSAAFTEDAIEKVEDALSNLEPTLEDEGIAIIEADKCLAVLRALSKGEIVHTLENILSDSEYMEDSLLKIHYLNHLSKSVVSDSRKINLTSLVCALRDTSSKSIKYLTPDDIGFISSSIPPSKMPTGSQNAAKQIEQMKQMKEELINKTSDLIKHEEEIKKQLESCQSSQNNCVGIILNSVKERFVSPAYSTTSTTSNTTGAASTSTSNVKVSAILNKAAEDHICRLEYDEAYEALSAEVNKLEKKLISQKSNTKPEAVLRKRFNELLLCQIELSEEKRLLHDKTVKDILAHSKKTSDEINQQRLQKGISDARLLDMKINNDLKVLQDQFDYNLIDTEEYFNKLLVDLNSKRIMTMEKFISTNNKKIERETKNYVRDTSEVDERRRVHEEISDELFNQLKENSEQMMMKFSKVYKTAGELIEENRKINNEDKSETRVKKVPLQTELVELYTDIHSLQHNFVENPNLDFEIELSKIVDEHEAKSLKFLNRSEKMYKEHQEKYMNLLLKRYDIANSKNKK